MVAYSSRKDSKTRTFKNTVKGIHAFIQTLSSKEDHCIVEATGNYSSLLIYLLNEAGVVTSLENPLKIKNFARAMLSTIKTDEVDARIIAPYRERMRSKPYKLPSDAIPTLRQKRTVIRQLKKQHIATRNLRGSMEALPFFDPSCKESVIKTITFQEKQIKIMEEDLSVLAHKEYKKQMDLLTSIKEKASRLQLHSSWALMASLTLIVPNNLPAI